LRMIGLRFAERDIQDVPRRERDYLEALYAAVVGLILVDTVVGTTLSARFAVFSFRSGYRLAIIGGLMLRASQIASRGGPVSQQEIELVRLAQDLVGRVNNDLERRIADTERDGNPPVFR